MLILYTKNGCAQCNITKYALKENGITPEERNVNTNPAYLEEAQATGYSSMPILVHNGQVIISGFQPDRLDTFIASQE